MNEPTPLSSPPPHVATPPLHLLARVLLGVLVGTLLGAAGLFAVGIVFGLFISVGYGLLGIIYLPLAGGAVGAFLGGTFGFFRALRIPDKDG